MFGINKRPSGSQRHDSLIKRLAGGLSTLRHSLVDSLGNLLQKNNLDEHLLEDLETSLLSADVGIETTEYLLEKIRTNLQPLNKQEPTALKQHLRNELMAILQSADKPEVSPEPGTPRVILMVGVNGAGKTTTIGKLAHQFKNAGQKVLLAAGDTFRAAAIEQLQRWGARNQIEVIAQHTGADSASVIFDAFDAARSRNFDVLIADTAGRLHSKANLMDELSKVVRVLRKLDSQVPHEILLVIDGSSGQNALHQAAEFNRKIGLSGVVVTKLDGTAKGGVLFSIADQLKLPVRYIGIGENLEDLYPFDAEDFIEALFSQ